jgi:peptide-methionine (R)-S-oxide reductase
MTTTQRVLDWDAVMGFALEGNPVPIQRVEKTEDEWRDLLLPEEFKVLRMKGTEPMFSGEYCHVHLPGIYACRACGYQLFDSSIKFDSGSGWPSFTQPVDNGAISYHLDRLYGMERVEVRCSSCDSHLGHVFPDGPEPTGLRYCINSLAIKIQASGQ